MRERLAIEGIHGEAFDVVKEAKRRLIEKRSTINGKNDLKRARENERTNLRLQ